MGKRKATVNKRSQGEDREDLQEANLRGTNLRNPDLTYSNLWGADLQDSNLDGIKFYPCQMPKHAGKLWGAKIREKTDLDMPPIAPFRWR